MEVWVRYHEEGDRLPGDGYQPCDDPLAARGAGPVYTRVREGFEHEAGGYTAAQQHATVRVAGVEVDATSVAPDASVPYQQLPEEGDPPLWLVQVGWVRWKPRVAGVGGYFTATTTAERTADRHYSSLVTSALLAPAGRLRIRDRASAPPPAAKETGDLAAVEGALRVDGRITGVSGLRLNGDAVYLAADAADAKPVELLRADGPCLTLMVPKGADPAKNRLALRFNADEKLTVNRDGDTTIAGKADVKGALRARTTAEFDGKATAKGELALEDRLTLGAATQVYGDAKLRGALSVAGDALIGAGGDKTLKTRHVSGKASGGDADDDLYLNWHNNLDVHVGNTGGSLRVADRVYVGRELRVGAHNATVLPCDIVTGAVHLNQIQQGLGTLQLDVTSRLPYVSSARIALGLTDIGNLHAANDARWAVEAQASPQRLTDNSFRFAIDWVVSDSDGYLLWFSYVVYFT
jgi:hypothetical protein